MKSPDSTEDERIAAKLQLPPEAVRMDRKQFNGNRVMREVHKSRLEAKIETYRSDLENTGVGEMQGLQGMIAGIRIAIALVCKEET